MVSVVSSRYGSITPGIAIAGIAAGLNYQTVPYNSYFVQPRTAQRRKVQSGIDHYRNLMSTNRQQFGGYGNPQSPGNVGWPGSANGQSGSGYRPNGPGAYGQDTYGSNNGQLNGYGNAYPSNSQGNGYGGGSGYGGNGNQGGNGYGGNGYQGGSGQQGVNGYGSNPQGSGVNFGGNGYNQNGNVDVDSRYAATLSGTTSRINCDCRANKNSSKCPCNELCNCYQVLLLWNRCYKDLSTRLLSGAKEHGTVRHFQNTISCKIGLMGTC